MSGIEVTTKHNLYERYWSLTKTECTVRSIMQLKPTCAKQSLVYSSDISLSRQHYALCVGTLKFQPTMVLQSCFAVRKEKWFSLASPALGSCYFYPYGWEIMLILVQKTHWHAEVLFWNFFPTKTSVLFLWQLYDNYFRVADMIWIFSRFSV